MVIVLIFVFRGDGDSNVVEETTTEEITEQAESEDSSDSATTGDADEQVDNSGTQDAAEGAEVETENTPLVDDSDVSVADAISPLPSNWNELSSSEKTGLNPYGCFDVSGIRADNGRCLVKGSRIEYFVLSMVDSSFEDGIRKSNFLEVAVPTASTDEQIGELIEHFEGQFKTSSFAYEIHIYNYADVSYEPIEPGLPKGWVTGLTPPRVLYESDVLIDTKSELEAYLADPANSVSHPAAIRDYCLIDDANCLT